MSGGSGRRPTRSTPDPPTPPEPAEPRSSAAFRWHAVPRYWAGALPSPRCRRSGGALPANQLAATCVGKLGAVMHKETAGTRELVGMQRDHPERELLVRKICSRQFKRLGNVVRIDVDRRRGLVHPPGLQFLQAVLGNVVVCLPRAVVIGSHLGSYPSIFTNLVRAVVTLGRARLCPNPAGNSATSGVGAHPLGSGSVRVSRNR